MKKFFILLPAIVLLAGCASSERAFRMSGGVFTSYTAPKNYRLRSEKFQRYETHSLPLRSGKDAVGGLDKTLVNIWPFYFRSNNYFSVLWPMIDWDPYGMAIRPFYNQEGDDHSILFPLSAWNTADRSGWVANFRWTRNGFGFIPLSWQSRTQYDFWCYYTPFFIRARNYRAPGFNSKENHFYYHGDSSFTEFLLGYYGSDSHLDVHNWNAAFYRNPGDRLKYLLWKNNRPFPKTPAELAALRADIQKNATAYRSSYGGFFPLFHLSRTPYKNRWHWNLLGILADAERNGGHLEWTAGLGWLLNYKRIQYKTEVAAGNYSRLLSERKFFSLVLLSGMEKRVYLKKTEQLTALLELTTLSAKQEFAKNLPKIKTLLKKLDLQTEIPEFINNSTLLHLFVEDFIKDYCARNDFPTETYTSNTCLPLFFYKNDENSGESSFIIPALLSGYDRNSNGDWNWLSIPLLSGAAHNARRDYLRIMAPLVYSDSSQRREAPGLFVHAADAKWPRDEKDNVESANTYAALGLFYRGKMKFLVAKPGFSNKDINTLVSLINQLRNTRKQLNLQEKQFAFDTTHANAIKPRNKIEEYEKLIVLEKLKLRRAALDKEIADFEKKIKETFALAKKLNFKLNITDWNSKAQCDSAVKALYAFAVTFRSKEDVGSGLFFRKEFFYNGDSKWRLFLNIAGGEKNGSIENTHVLYLIYRNRRDGNKQEKLIFPFISIQKEGENSRVSFLGRIYQKSVINGKTSGYIFFIPF